MRIISVLAAVIFVPTMLCGAVRGKPVKLGEDATPRKVFVDGQHWLTLEFVADHIVHFEFGQGSEPKPGQEIYRSPLYDRVTFPGTNSFKELGNNRYQTREMNIEVKGLCFAVADRLRGNSAGSYCVDGFAKRWKNLKVATRGVQNIYGLGQIFEEPGKTTADRAGKVVTTSGDFGNIMQTYAGGATGETMFPVAYALTDTERSWVLALDNIYKQSWDFTSDDWQIGMFGDRVSGFVVVGANPLDLRKRFMAMVGKAPVPPRKIFGYWMSEYGYDNWQEIDDRLQSMRHDRFPIDGFFLDLQWFGNVSAGSDYTAMGKLQFDESKFPDPRGHIAAYKKADIGLIPIEESYVGKALPEHDMLSHQGFLAHECGNPNRASYLTGDVTGNTSEWWGRGGMIDWSNTGGAAYWHDLKRQKLIDLGLIGHWLDLGEPEMFDPKSCYAGSGEPGKIQHQDVHNIFALLWVRSLYDGYARNHVRQRPYSILRSGNVGMQRYGAGMWSGDIGGNLESLSAHIGSHSEMSWSGIDYYSSDIGGFHRNRASGQALSELETKENFTAWFANASWLDVPVRSHVMNLNNDKQTAPNRIGHVESNYANIMERYRLGPYYYSLAWMAWIDGSPLIAPMAMAFPKELPLRDSGDQKLLGDILIATASGHAAYSRDVRLPHGLWYDLRTGLSMNSLGSERTVLKGVPLYFNGLYQLPTYARAGAIIPKLPDAEIQKSKGNKAFNRGDSMNLDVYVQPSGDATSFVLFEDDGTTNAFREGAVRQTMISQVTSDHVTKVVIKAATGDFSGAQTSRHWSVNFHGPVGWALKEVRYLGQIVAECSPSADPESVCIRPGRSIGSAMEINLGMTNTHSNQQLEVRWDESGDITASAHFVCREPDSAQRYTGMYIVGNHPRLGSWDLAKAIPLTTNGYLHGVWTANVDRLPAGVNFEWKCVKVHPQSSGRGAEWQPGGNNSLTTRREGGFSGLTQGSFAKAFGR